MLYIDERAVEEGLSQKIVLKEALQVSVLERLYSVPESEAITFQGGTCLRLLYGAPRYSEDLDFVVSDMSGLPGLFEKVKPSLNKLSPLFEGKIWMRVQKDSVNIVRWKLYYEALEGRENTSVTIEFANYPAYTSQLLPLRIPKGYPAIPLILVKAETEEEIFADKITAMASRRYLKGRDIFDIWLLKGKGVQVNVDMVEKKFRDYAVPKVNMEERILQFTEDWVRQDLENYFPRNYRERFQKEGYRILLAAAGEVAREVDKRLRRHK